MHQINYKTL